VLARTCSKAAAGQRTVSVRGRPVASCSEWHGDGTVGEHDRASHLIVKAQTRAMGAAVQVDTSLVGKRHLARGS
jgi:hypothetical protein